MNRKLKKETFAILAIGVFILACIIIFSILNYPSKSNVMSRHDRIVHYFIIQRIRKQEKALALINLLELEQ